MTAVEQLVSNIRELAYDKKYHLGMGDIRITQGLLDELEEQAKEMEKEQRGYSEEDVREMLFMALYETQQECCTTHTKDSIVRKVLKTFNQLRLAEQLENELDNL